MVSGLMPAFQNRSLKLPKVDAPSIDGITIKVPRSQPVTDREVQERLADLQRMGASLTPRAHGAVVEAGDEVCIDVIGRFDGKIVPRSFEVEKWFSIDEPTSVPEVGKAVLGAKVGSRLEVKAKLPQSFFEPFLAGKPAVFTVDVKAARQVKRPAFNDPDFWDDLGVNSIEQAQQFARELVEHQREQEGALRALQAATDAVLQRAAVTLDEPLVLQELWAVWSTRGEGKELSLRGFTEDELVVAFDTWAKDRPRVDDFSKTLKQQLVFAAIAEKHKAELTVEAVSESAERWLPLIGVSAETVMEASKDPTRQTELSQVIAQFATADLILNQVKVEKS